MERSDQGTAGVVSRVVCASGRREAHARRDTAPGVLQGDIGADSGRRQVPEAPLRPTPPPNGGDPRTTEEAPSETGSGSASDLIAREQQAAQILYMAYAKASGRYAPQWPSASNHAVWRSSAAALLAAIDTGVL